MTRRTMLRLRSLTAMGRSASRLVGEPMRIVQQCLVSGQAVTAAHVVGHSFGGATAATLAVQRPERVASLTLLEPVFTLSWPPAGTFVWTTLLALPAPQAWRDEAMAHIGGIPVEQVRQRTPLSSMIAAGAEFYRAALPAPGR